MKWFKHDSNAAIDAKIERLIIRYGLEGYGLYFYCLELIAQNIEAHNITFELEHDAEVIAHRVKLHADHVQEMMSYMIDLGLFENNAGTITCMRMAQRLDSSMVSNPKMRKMITKIRDNSSNSHDAVMIWSAVSHDTIMQEENRIEQKRIDKRKTKSRFTPPSVEEVKEQVDKKGYHVDAECFCNFYGSKDWMVGKNKMKNWQMALANWAARNNTGNTANPWDGAI